MTTVHVVGNVCVDRSFHLDRLPRPGETLNARSSREGVGGKGFNQAVAAVRAGADVRFHAAVGEDAAGDRLAGAVAAEGLDGRLVRLALPTDMSAILVAAGGENLIVTAAACAEGFDPMEASDLVAGLRPDDLLLMQGNLTVEATDRCLAAARAAGARTILNPSPIADRTAAIAGLDLLVANRSEALAITGEDDPERAVRALAARGARAAIVTLGPGGAVMADRNGIHRRAAPAVAAVDTSGAGDCYAGTLVGLIAAGWTLPDAMEAAAAAAAVAVTRPGTLASFPSRSEVADHLDHLGITARRA